MKRILFILLLSVVSGAVFSQDTTTGVYNDQRGNFFIKVKNSPAWKIDGYNIVIRGGDTLKRVRSAGSLTAEELNILPNGSDMASQLSAVANIPSIREIRFVSDSSRKYVINGSVNIHGKTLSFQNGGMIAGTGTIDSAIIYSSDYDHIFDTTLTLTNLKSSRNYITPQMFGAKGDGITDDTKAIQASFNVQYINVTFPVGIYKISDSVTLHYSSVITMPANSEILATQTDRPAVIIGYPNGTPPSTERDRRYSIRVRRSTQSDWTNMNSIGVLMRNLFYCKVEMIQAKNFTVGLRTVGKNGGFSYVDFNLGQFLNNERAIWIDDESDGPVAWNNQNNYYGGWLECFSNINVGKPRYGVVIGHEGGYTNTNNVFHGQACELVSNLAIPILILNGTRNVFYDWRSEGNSGTFILVKNGYNNEIRAGKGSGGDKIVDSSMQGSNWYQNRDQLDRIYARAGTVIDETNLVQRLTWGEDSTVSFGGKLSFIERTVEGTVYRKIKGPKIKGKFLSINSTNPGGVITDYIDVSQVKKWLLRTKVPDDSSGRSIYIMLFDEAGKNLGGSVSPPQISGISAYPTYTTNFGGSWITSNTTAIPRMITVSDTAKKMRIILGMSNSTGELLVESFKLMTYGDGISGLYDYNTSDYNEASSIPSVGSFKKGKIIRNSNPVSGEAFGWVVKKSGTFDTLQSRTGTISKDNNKMTLSAGTGGRLNVGEWIAYSGDTGQIIGINADTIYLSSNASANRTNVAINYPVPEFGVISKIDATGGGISDWGEVKDSVSTWFTPDQLKIGDIYSFSHFYTTTPTTNDPFYGTAISSGSTGTPTGTNNNQNNPGIVLLKSSTTPNSGYRFLGNLTTLLTGGTRTDAILKVFSDPTITTRFGFMNSTTDAAPTNGVYFEITNTSIVGKTTKASATSTTSVSRDLATLDNMYYHLSIEMNNAGDKVYFKIDSLGTTIFNDSLSTNIPTIAIAPGIISTSSGTTEISLLTLDFMGVGSSVGYANLLKTSSGIGGGEGGSGSITLTGDVTGSGTGSVATTVSSNAITYAKIQQSTGLSVIGRSANSTGNVAAITAGADGNIFYRSGTNLVFGKPDLVGSISTSLSGYIKGTGSSFSASAGIPYADLTGVPDWYFKNSPASGDSLLYANGDTLFAKRIDVASTNSIVRTRNVNGDKIAYSFALDGDASSPGNNKLYGTNASGVKGWYSQPGGSGDTLPAKPSGYLLAGTGSAGYDSTGLYWDKVNGRLGVGTNTPQYDISVDGTILTKRFQLSGNGNNYLSDDGGGTTTLSGNTQLRLAAGSEKIRLLTSRIGVNADVYFGNVTTPPTAVVDIAESSTTKSSLRIREGTRPTSPNQGDIYTDNSDHKPYYYDGSSWYDLTATGGGEQRKSNVVDNSNYTIADSVDAVIIRSASTSRTIGLPTPWVDPGREITIYNETKFQHITSNTITYDSASSSSVLEPKTWVRIKSTYLPSFGDYLWHAVARGSTVESASLNYIPDTLPHVGTVVNVNKIMVSPLGYFKIGKTVTVFGKVSIEKISDASGVLTRFALSLPAKSIYETLSGGAVSISSSTISSDIYLEGDPGKQRVLFVWNNTTSGDNEMDIKFRFSYDEEW